MYKQFTAAGILAEIPGDNAIEVTPETAAAVRDCLVASVGQFNIIREEVADFDPMEDAVAADGSIEKGAATEVQKQMVGLDDQIRQLRRQGRAQQRV